MKKTIKPMLAVGLFLLLLTNACKKNDLPATTTAQETVITAQQAGRTGSANQGTAAQSALQPNATVEITPGLFGELDGGNLIRVVPVSQGLFRAVGVVNIPNDPTGPTGPVEPYNPCAGAWAAYSAYMAAHIAEFQAWANANCKPFRGAWGHSCGLCVLFQVDPTNRWNCLQEAFTYNQNLAVYATASAAITP